MVAQLQKKTQKQTNKELRPRVNSSHSALSRKGSNHLSIKQINQNRQLNTDSHENLTSS